MVMQVPKNEKACVINAIYIVDPEFGDPMIYAPSGISQPNNLVQPCK